jgi:hypothetical protein
VLYAKAIAFTLIAMFSIHLVMRAYWVALMGIHSVFPRGIRWSELKAPPISREFYRSRMRDTGATIARLDNVCSVMFSVGLLIVLMFAFSTVIVGTCAAIGYVAAHAMSGGRGTQIYTFSLLALFAATPLVARLWDKRAGDRYAPGSRPYRVLRRLVVVSYTLSVLRILGPMMFTLMSNVGRARVMVFLYASLVLLIFLASVDRLVNSDRLTANTYDFYGASRRHAVDYRFYEDQREKGRPYPRVPSIQSDVIRDPYIKLFIPYYPQRDNAAIAKVCPNMPPLQSRGIQLGADSYLADSLTVPVLQCISRLHDVKLDGTPIENLEFSFYEQRESGVKGVIAYIPVDSAMRGKHMLQVTPTPSTRAPKDSATAASAAQPLVIPFWR